ncbi:hypothetical protein BDV97DRAFT_126681 [Delphinella strobiligena]|nr:hypothetical protein BDV97DRAFT_126681 [Delphinella strobiligena]
MGQATSSETRAASPNPQPAPETNRRRVAPWRRSLIPFSDRQETAGGDERESADLQEQEQEQEQEHERGRRSRPRRARSASLNRLSQFLNSTNISSSSRDTSSRYNDSNADVAAADDDYNHGDDDDDDDDDTSTLRLRRPSRLQRARTSINTSLSNLSFRRVTPHARTHNTSSRARPTLQPPAATDGLDFNLPDLSAVEPLDLNFDDLTTTVSAGRPATPRTPSSRSSLRFPNGISDRLDRLSAFPRRRRSPLTPLGAAPGSTREGGLGGAAAEDNTALLSRLLSVAAAATAATLLEGNQQAIADARSVAGDGDDGTFNSFLQSLESGRLAAALRGAQPNNDQAGATSTPQTHAPLNFFRMFRFGSPAPTTPASGRGGAGSTAAQSDNAHSPSPSSNTDGRMVPIIIVGIRSVNPASGNDNTDDNGMPPFLDALSALPTTPFGETPVDHDSIDNILRSPQNGTHFTHRRRASMGGVNSIASGYDAQRHHRSPERNLHRPLSTASDAAQTSRPAPASPTSPSLSRLTSTASIPSSRPNSIRSSRRESIIRTTTTTTLETTSEDAPLRPRAPRQRRLSESDYRTTFSSRRNGIVEPDHPSPPSENTRSWIIYVLGGSYPENHPILTTPSLFTDSPTYEDMMLLSALLGPAKPPVASEEDVSNAGGIFKIQTTQAADHGLTLVAVDQSQTLDVADGQRCLVCLCDFEHDEEARQLVKCKHLFHRECIDEWLTKGRNSCPLCRGQGVDEKEKVNIPSPATADDSPPLSAVPSSDTSFVDAASPAA